MNNPFILQSKSGKMYVGAKASINKMVIAKVPIAGIEDNIEGLNAKDIFSTQTIVSCIREKVKECGILLENTNNSYLPVFITREYDNVNGCFHNQACEIIRKFGYRLGIILLTLKTGLKENKVARDDWSDDEWIYYQNLHTIVLVGGLASGRLGVLLKKYALDVFEMAHIEPYKLIMFDNSTHFGVLGCTKKIKKLDSVNVVFDFGQTNIKRSIVFMKKGKMYYEEQLESINSKFMEDSEDEKKRREDALKLHKYIVDIVTDTYIKASQNWNVGNEIIISIASYTVDGILNDKRGGYAKLAGLADNYKVLLENDLGNVIGDKVDVTLIHDGTAMAYYFSEYKETCCISIGTGFGVGFPEISM